MDVRAFARYGARWLVVLAAALVVCLGVSACLPLVAQAETAAPPQEGSLTVHIYQTQTGGTEPGFGGEDPLLPADALPIAGIPFELAKLSDDATAANGFDPTITIDSPPLATFTPRTGTTDEQGEVSFAGLERGVYLLTQAAADGYRPAQQKLLVAVPMDGVAGSGQRWNVHVYPKSYAVDALSKTAEDPQRVYGVGDEARWRIVEPIPSSLKQPNADGTFSYGHSWQVRDLLDERLDFVAGAHIELLNAAGKPASAALVLGTDVVESYDAASHRVTWAITDEALRRVADSDAAELAIVVTTRVNELAYASTSALYNNAQVSLVSATGVDLEHSVIPDSGPDAANPAHPRIHTGGIVIDKHLEGMGEKLAGAVFKVALTRDDALAGRFLTHTVDGAAQDIQLVTDEHGAASLGGLGPGTYWLLETQAPSYTDADGKQRSCVRLTEPAAVEVPDDPAKAVVGVSVANRLETPLDQAGSAMGGALTKTGDTGRFVLVALVATVALAGVTVARRGKRQRAEHTDER